MATVRTLYIFSPNETGRESLRRFVFALKNGPGPRREEIHTFDELQGRLEGGEVDFLLLDGRRAGARMLECLGEQDPDRLLTLSLAQLEKRHVLRVLASTGGNKTRAARILGIDTKTLYNKLKSYQTASNTRHRRLQPARKSVQA